MQHNKNIMMDGENNRNVNNHNDTRTMSNHSPFKSLRNHSPLTQRKVTAKKNKSGSILHILSEETAVDVYEDLALSKVMNPIYISMACFGLIWRSQRKFLIAERFDLCTVHCCFMIALVWLNALHYFVAYTSDDSYGQVLFKKVTGHLFALQMACGISTYIYFNHKHIPYFLKEWENYKLSHGGLSLSSMTKKVFKRVVVVNILLLCFYSLLSVFLVLSSRRVHVEMSIPIHKYIADPEPLWLKILYAGFNLYIVMAWLQSLIFTACVCNLLNREFKQLAAQFLKAAHTDGKDRQAYERLRNIRLKQSLDRIPEGSYSPPSPMAHRTITFETEQYRKRHMALCKLVSRLDQIMSSYLLFLYMFSVPIVVFLLYGLWDYSDEEYSNDLTTLVINVIRLFFFVMLLGCVTRAGASLAAAVSVSHVMSTHVRGRCIALEKNLSLFLCHHIHFNVI